MGFILSEGNTPPPLSIIFICSCFNHICAIFHAQQIHTYMSMYWGKGIVQYTHTLKLSHLWYFCKKCCQQKCYFIYFEKTCQIIIHDYSVSILIIYFEDVDFCAGFIQYFIPSIKLQLNFMYVMIYFISHVSYSFVHVYIFFLFHLFMW
jgi:hypothetical protein